MLYDLQFELFLLKIVPTYQMYPIYIFCGPAAPAIHKGAASLNRGKPCEASQFSRVRCDLAETHAASGALISQRNINTIFLVHMSLHKLSNQLVREYGIHVRFI